MCRFCGCIQMTLGSSVCGRNCRLRRSASFWCCCAQLGRLMVVVPNAALRDKITGKLATLGKLVECGCVPPTFRPPVVAKLRHRPKLAQEVEEIFRRANVVVANMNDCASLDLGDKDGAIKARDQEPSCRPTTLRRAACEYRRSARSNQTQGLPARRKTPTPRPWSAYSRSAAR